MSAIGNQSTDQTGPLAWKVVHLVPARSNRETGREHRERSVALERVRHLYDDLLTKCGLFTNAPFDQLCIVIGIDAAQPKRPWLDRLSRKKRQLTAILEFDWK